MLKIVDQGEDPFSDYDDSARRLIMQAEVLRAKLDIPRLKRKLRRRARWQALIAGLLGFFRTSSPAAPVAAERRARAGTPAE